MPTQDPNKIIDEIGGTQVVADLCEVTKGAVSQWRKKYIPQARLMFLRLARPEVFADRRTTDKVD